MFKVKVQELSPPSPIQASRKRFVAPSPDAAGNLVGKDNKNVDVKTIILRPDALGMTGFDWPLIRKLTDSRSLIRSITLNKARLSNSSTAPIMAISGRIMPSINSLRHSIKNDRANQ